MGGFGVAVDGQLLVKQIWADNIFLVAKSREEASSMVSLLVVSLTGWGLATKPSSVEFVATPRAWQGQVALALDLQHQ